MPRREITDLVLVALVAANWIFDLLELSVFRGQQDEIEGDAGS